MKRKYKLLFLLISFINLFIETSSMNVYERMMMKKSDPTEGLYSAADSIVVLTNENFNQTAYNRNVGVMIEFYNSFCGACQRFSSVYKAFTKDVERWRPIFDIAAVDCANENNNALCRNMEIMRYPSLKYFPPKTRAPSLGRYLDHLLMPELNDLINEAMQVLVNESQGGDNWPIFSIYSENSWDVLFKNVTNPAVKYVYVISDVLPKNASQQAILDFVGNDNVFVRIFDSANTDLMVMDSAFRLGAVDRNGNVEELKYYNESRNALTSSIDKHLRRHHINIIKPTTPMPSQSSPSSNEDQNSNVTTEMLLERHFYDTARKLNPMPLFRADLEQAIRNTLSHEIPQHETITGESLNALRNFVSVLYRYYEFGNQISFRKLVDYVTQPSKTEIKGEELKIFIDKLIPPIIRKSRYVGCYSTSKGLRRFPCSLWTLFHHLTIQHLESEHNDDPMEVLHAIHGYVKYFFGCSDCSRHFQEMSKRNHIWNVTSKDQAVLWLWNAHNEVNQRLHGDITEDSNHPKLQFPAEEHCHVCRKKNGEWDKTEVLEFLRRHYINERVSNLGLDEDQMPRALMLNARARQMFAGGLGESHLHIGILAYVAIIVCMMILAVKFYFRRGYRKKLYAHDILGKV